MTLSVLKYRYPNLFNATQLARAKGFLSKPLETFSYTVAEEKLCMSRLITYASDEGKSFPMLIGADYNEEVRSQMALFLVSEQEYKKTVDRFHLINICSCASIYEITIQHIAHNCLGSSSTFPGTYRSNMDSYSHRSH